MATSNSKSKTPTLAQQLEAAHVAHQQLLLDMSVLREDNARLADRVSELKGALGIAVEDLEAAVAAINAAESRRAYEGAAYRAKLAATRPAPRVAPSDDASIPDSELTRGQLAIRQHRAARAA